MDTAARDIATATREDPIVVTIKKPPKPVCPLCALDDDIVTVHLGEGVWQHSCTGGGHPEPWVWRETSESALDDLALEGVTQEWGLYDDLPKCLVKGEPFVEYGVVEYRYSKLNPAMYAFLVGRYGHTALAPKNYTASSFIASALGRLWKRGDLDAEWGAATGRWHYNGTVSYWRLPGIDANDGILSWAEFAQLEGVDPMDWTLP